ncbi:CheY-like chemotaxis protein [Flavobacterium arsenatis]|uniref:CheY-like chemotaxis protein n=1 Tax=Flavobacterium arsenatis TaxID=1484332 RepID=A0ABU1TPT9_9FLAO|nr:response regulator [Flavobacterium arsenatis]MDR6967981.1 CheY-like chemotaxis protein [Flavobacterium arsenatis]
MALLENLHIIIAEDDIDDGEIIEQSFLKHPSFNKISIVKNGKELLEFLKTANHKPDVILTDINMPIINGIEALAEISNDLELNHITTFAYSTSINPIYESKCLQYGVKGFLIKPFVLEEFDEIPHKIINTINSLSE